MPKRVFTQTFGVVGAILERGGKILLVKEAKAGADTDKWSHPDGWIDVGENPIEAVKREVEEESGYDFRPQAVLGVYSLVRRYVRAAEGATPHAIKLIFSGQISDQPNQELHNDVSETRWFTPAEIYAMDEKTLRDLDIKQMVKDYFAGKKYPLDLLHHTEAF